MGMDIRQTNCPSRLKGGTWGGGCYWSNIQKSREAVKRLNRLAPTLVHVCGFIWECQTDGPIGTKFGTRLWIHLKMDIGKNNSPYDTPRRHLGDRVQQFKSLGNVAKRLDRLGINCAHIGSNAGESGNGHRLNKLAP